MPGHEVIRLKIGDEITYPWQGGTIHVKTNGVSIGVVVETPGWLNRPAHIWTLPITSHGGHGVAHFDELNLDVVVIPREVSDPAVFDTGITDEYGRTSPKTGNLRIHRDGSWDIYGRYGPIAAGSGGPAPVKLDNLRCAICGKKVPKRSIDDLIQLEWTGIEIKREDERKEKAYICPDHVQRDVVAFMGSAIEHGKIPRVRAHCIKVRGKENG